MQYITAGRIQQVTRPSTVISPPLLKKACPQALSELLVVVQIVIIVQPFFLAFNPVFQFVQWSGEIQVGQVEIPQLIGGILKIRYRIPFWVFVMAYPAYIVFQDIMVLFNCQDFFDFLFFVLYNLDWRRGAVYSLLQLVQGENRGTLNFKEVTLNNRHAFYF